MDEFTAVLKARDFVNNVNPVDIPVDINSYADHIGATIRYETDLGEDESGWCFRKGDKYYICVNDNESEERNRFTICHEIAHIVLELPSDHDKTTTLSYEKRSPNEILCDVFAAELLLPYQLFKPFVDDEMISFETIEDCASRFTASITSTGSRYATAVSAPCIFVLSEKGRVRYASRSLSMREANAWIPTRTEIPVGSLSARVRAGKITNDSEEVDPNIWFSDWNRGGILLEEARHLNQWDQTLSLLWFEDDEVPHSSYEEDSDLMGLKELDGILEFPSRKRRR